MRVFSMVSDCTLQTSSDGHTTTSLGRLFHWLADCFTVRIFMHQDRISSGATTTCCHLFCPCHPLCWIFPLQEGNGASIHILQAVNCWEGRTPRCFARQREYWQKLQTEFVVSLMEFGWSCRRPRKKNGIAQREAELMNPNFLCVCILRSNST